LKASIYLFFHILSPSSRDANTHSLFLLAPHSHFNHQKPTTMMMSTSSVLVAAALLALTPSHAFAPVALKAPSTATSLSALTERQMQFWEDVDTGLNDVEAFYKQSKGLTIDRVRQFAKRCVSVLMW
jgi:hypothetical protein